MVSKTDIEQALANGKLWAAMRNGRYWRLRRNGKTQTWVRDPARFRIPVKAGLKSYGEITNESTVTVGLGGDFVIADNDPNGE